MDAKELGTTADLVKSILMQNEQSRNDDNFLYYLVLKVHGLRKGIDIDNMSILHFFMQMKQYGFPAFETVRRTRQKLQATFPELSSNKSVQGYRRKNEDVYREYARSR